MDENAYGFMKDYAPAALVTFLKKKKNFDRIALMHDLVAPWREWL